MSLGGLYVRNGGEFVVNSTVTGDQKTPAVAALASGGYVVVWNDASGQGLCAQRYDASGNKVGGEIVVNATADIYNPGTVVALASGGFAVAWADPTNPLTTTRIQVFDSAGSKVGGELVSAFSGSGLDGAAISGGHFVLVNDGGQGRIFDGSGAAIGAAFQMPNTLGFVFTDVAALSGGGFAMVGTTTDNKVAVQRYASNGTLVGSEVAFDDPFHSPANFSVTGLSGGGLALAWSSSSSNEIYLRTYDAVGNATSAVIPFTSNLPSVTAADPQVTALTGDQFLLTWTSTNGGGLIASDVRGQVFSSSGLALGTEFLVSQGTDHPNRNHGEAESALLASGDVVTVWSGAGPGDPRTPGTPPPDFDHGIRGQIFAPLAAAPTIQFTSSTTSVNEVATDNLTALLLSASSTAVNASYQFQLLADGTGGAFALNGDHLIVIDNDLLDADTAPSENLTIRVTDNAGHSADFNLALSVTNDLIEQRYSAGTETQDSVETTYSQYDSAVATLDTGGFVVVWTDGSWKSDGTGTAVLAQLHDAAGAKIGVPFLVNTWGSATQDEASVTALDGGGFVVTWSSAPAAYGDDIRAQLYQSNGTKVGGELAINNATQDSQELSAVVALPGGGFAVVWSLYHTSAPPYERSIRWQTFDASGTAVGTEQIVNATDSGNQSAPSVAALSDGRFVVTWTDDSGLGGDASSTAIKAQRLDAAGNKIGGEFLVNTKTSGGQSASSVTAIDGGFVVAWQDVGTIKAQVFDLAGQRVGGEISVAPNPSPPLFIPGGGIAPVVTALPGEGFAIAWSGADPAQGDTSSRAVMLQVFDSSGTPMGAKQAINATTIGSQDSPALAALPDGTIVASWTDFSRYYQLGDIKVRLITPKETAIDGTAGADTLNATGTGIVFGKAGNDTINGTASNDTLVGGVGDDHINLNQGGNDTASGGAGNDAFYFGAAFTAADTVDGGGGSNDQIGLQGNYTGGNALVLGTNTIANIEVIAVLPGFDYSITTVDANVPAGGTLKVFAGNLGAGDNFTFNGSAETNGAFMVYGGAGIDLITTGAGTDGIYFGPGKFNPATDVVNGGTGTNDQLALDGDYTLTLDGTAIKNIDAIALLPGVAGDLADYNLTVANSLVGAGQTMTIWGTPLLTALTVNGSAETDGHLKLYGGTLGDTLTGGQQDDWFWGGTGGDSITGGNGADTFLYQGIAESNAAGYDKLIGFNDNVDKIDLPFAVSGFAAPLSGALNAASLGSGLATAFAGLTANQAGVFTATGGDLNGHTFLVVNADGATGYQAASDYLIEMVSPASPVDNVAMFA